ncbi:MAG: hypothetical protein CL927_06065 [Deltaproteobacteria bacterium]|nr:hypothetical protein [Deltaproteobacteria bacterium]HCH66131.1 hypothetical protein [Deltaproteobacteria bacterium]
MNRSAERRPLALLPVAVWALLGALLPGTAAARTYPVEIGETNEDELRNLYEDGLLSADEFDTLVELLNNPIDVNRASRQELYDLPYVTLATARSIVLGRRKGPYASLKDMAERVEAVTPDVLDQIQPFATAAMRERSGFDKNKVTGKARIRTGMYFEEVEPIEGDHANRTHTPQQLGYANLPATQANADVTYDRTYSAGAVVLSQPDIRGIAFNPQSRDFHATYGQVVQLGRIYTAVEKERWEVIVGSYSAGFGLGLTFDRTSRTQPNGWYKDLSVTADEFYRQFRLPRRLFGAAATVYTDIGSWEMESTVFTSMDRYDLYQYDMGMTGGEAVDWTEVETDSPRVYIEGQKVGWMRMPNAYRESLAGVNTTFSDGARSSVGLTAYAGTQDRTVLDGMNNNDEFVIRGGYPVLTDTYGAVGLNGSWGTGMVDFFGEYAYSFTGGSGVLVKSIINPTGGEIELSARHYGTEFDNPHARGTAAPDEYQGMRDRDEQGLRAKGFYDITEAVRFTGTVDYWRSNLELAPLSSLMMYGRVNTWVVEKKFMVGVYGRRTDQNLASSGRGNVYGGSTEDLYEDIQVESGTYDLTEATDRSGTRNFTGMQVRVVPIAPLDLSALYQRTWTDTGLLYPTEEGPCEYWYQIGHYGWFKARYKVIDPTTVTWRIRYRDDDIHGSRELRMLDTYLQVDQKLPNRWKIVTRGFMGWNLVDSEADFKGYCDRQGAPELSGSCVASPNAIDDDTEAETAEKFGYVWLSVEKRF